MRTNALNFTSFEKVHIEVLEVEKCQHEFMAKVDSQGWIPLRQCRKCRSMKVEEMLYPEGEIK